MLARALGLTVVVLTICAIPAAAAQPGDPSREAWLGKRPGGWAGAPSPAPSAALRRSAPAPAAGLTPCEEDPTLPVRHGPGAARSPSSRRADGEHPRRGLPARRTGRGRGRGVRHLRRPRLLDHRRARSTASRSSCSRRSRETRDLVFVDQRGVGLSDVDRLPGAAGGAADCCTRTRRPATTSSATPPTSTARPTSRTTSTTCARALGYGRIDLFGGSYAGADMMTYAVRHTKRVRSVVLASPAVVVGVDPFYAYAPEAMTAIAGKVCGRSPACRAANPAPGARVRRGRARPAPAPGERNRHRLGGRDPRRLNVTENVLANLIMYFNGAHFTGPGEIIPAMAAARSGDTVPLLRLGADNDPAHGFGERPARVLRRARPACAAASRASCRSTRAPGGRPVWRSSRARTRASPRSTATSPSRPGRIPASSASSRRPASRGAGRSGRCTARARASRASRRSCSAASTTCPFPRPWRSSRCA